MATTEAKYSFTTKINGDLFTVRGDDVTEFVINLSAVYDQPSLHGLLTGLAGASNTVGGAAIPPDPRTVQAAGPWASSVPQAAPAAPVTGFACVHGARTHRTGKSAKGAWEAYFCPQRGSDCKPMNADGTFWK